MRIILFFASVVFLPLTLLAQPRLPGQWSLEGDFGYTIPTSTGMKGTSSQFQQDIQKDYNSRSYPFGDSRAFSGIASAILSYRFPSSAWSAYGAMYGISSTVDNGFARNTMLSENADLFDLAYIIGAEYTLGQASEALNAFGRVGIGLSWFAGDVNYFGNHVELSPTFRGSVDLGIGGRWNWSFAPISIEISLSYLDANLIGKSYETPGTTPPGQLLERSLNDGKNPNDPNDVSRAIAYFSMRLGGRIWF